MTKDNIGVIVLIEQKEEDKIKSDSYVLKATPRISPIVLKQFLYLFERRYDL